MFGVNSKSIADSSRAVLQHICSVHTVVEGEQGRTNNNSSQHDKVHIERTIVPTKSYFCLELPQRPTQQP